MEKVEIARAGVLSMIACATKDATKEEIEEYVNTQHPTGISSKWTITDEPFNKGSLIETPNPGQCELYHDRLHYLLVC
jgi:type IV pilus biogenesis protein CpaD/CtpE